MATLVVCLPSAVAGPSVSYSYVRSTDGEDVFVQTANPMKTGTAAALPKPGRGVELVAVVPAAALSWHAVDLPDGLNANSALLRSVLGGLLEDQLLDDLENMQLALAPQTRTAANNQTWVAACDKTWLQGHLQLFESSLMPVSRVVPEFSPHLGPTELHAVGEAESAFYVMTGASAGGLMRLPFSAAALPVMPKPAEHESWQIFAEPALAAAAEHMLQSKVNLLTRPRRWLDAANTTWDLAQFDLAHSARSRRLKIITGGLQALLRAPQWRPFRWGVLTLILANIAGLNAWAWQQNRNLADTRAAVQNTLTQTFPAVKVVVDAPLQMQREINVLRQASGTVSAGDMEVMLAALSRANLGGRSLSSIDFASGELRVKGLDNDLQQVGVLSNQLRPNGYTAQLEGDLVVIKPESDLSRASKLPAGQANK